MQRTEELLDLGATDWVDPTFRLDVDQVEAELVFADHAVDAFIAALAEMGR
jgi:hypothetical protein